jgi:hypothetical protein
MNYSPISVLYMSIHPISMLYMSTHPVCVLSMSSHPVSVLSIPSLYCDLSLCNSVFGLFCSLSMSTHYSLLTISLCSLLTTHPVFVLSMMSTHPVSVLCDQSLCNSVFGLFCSLSMSTHYLPSLCLYVYLILTLSLCSLLTTHTV